MRKWFILGSLIALLAALLAACGNSDDSEVRGVVAGADRAMEEPKTNTRGWRISGGDVAQVSAVVGILR